MKSAGYHISIETLKHWQGNYNTASYDVRDRSSNSSTRRLLHYDTSYVGLANEYSVRICTVAGVFGCSKALILRKMSPDSRI